LFSGDTPEFPRLESGAKRREEAIAKAGNARIHSKAAMADADPNYSVRIREGIPAPH